MYTKKALVFSLFSVLFLVQFRINHVDQQQNGIYLVEPFKGTPERSSDPDLQISILFDVTEISG